MSTDDDMLRIGAKYKRWVSDAWTLRHELTDAIRAVNHGEVDPAFGRELAAALKNLDGIPPDNGTT